MRQLEIFAMMEKKVPDEEKQEQMILPDETMILSEDNIEINFDPESTKDISEQVSALPQKPAKKKPAGFDESITLHKRGRKSYKEIDAELVYVEVPDEAILFQKQYYSISEVAGWFHVNTSLLRFWETEFDILKPRKNRKGDRLFRPEDVKNLCLIYYLLRQRKFSIEGAKCYLKENKNKAGQNMELMQSLLKLKSFLLELKANLGT